jgi:transcriptional regulator with XRE-family HTH domain
MATVMKSIASYVEERGITERDLATSAGLDLKLVKAIVSGNFTPSPMHRQRLAGALGIAPEDVAWGHAVPVEHLRGNGPQCGRPT